MALDRLLGTWTTVMHHVQLPEPVIGRQVYERVLDGAFVMMRASSGDDDVPGAIALLDDSSMHYFDVRGVKRVFDLEVDEAGWHVIRRDPDFWQRSAVRFVGPGAMEGSGENSHDEGATWEHDFTMTYARVE